MTLPYWQKAPQSTLIPVRAIFYCHREITGFS